MTAGPYDPRCICNLMLDEAGKIDISISNLALQKLLYFAHARHLVETKQPLVSGYFEAWRYGPVHPTAYKAFKAAANQPITFRACRQDPLTGHQEPLSPPESSSVIRLARMVVGSYGTLTPGRLVEISHADDAPWAHVVEQARSEIVFGLRISDNVILERFKFHKVSVGPSPMAGEPDEDTPFA